MGRQSRIYVADSDLDALAAIFDKAGPVSFLRYRSPGPRPERLADLRVGEMGNEGLMVLACRESDVSSVRTSYVNTKHYWTVDTTRSNVIEVSRSFFDGTLCSPGRLWFATGYYDESGDWFEKDVEFLRWGDRVLRAVRKEFVRDRELGAYLGPEAARLRAQGAVRFPLNW